MSSLTERNAVQIINCE